jgi:hypothetical protein
MAVNISKFSIPTEFNGIRFRSKLEADWAAFFERHRIIYAFEPEGFDLDGVYYLPDFWLPRLRTFVEIKGCLDGNDEAKLEALARHCADPHDWEDKRPLLILAEAPVGEEFTNPYCSPSGFYIISRRAGLYQCRRCGNWWFANPSGPLKCRACGEWRSDDHITRIHGYHACPDCEALCDA